VLALGVWLFISAFIWPHSMASQTNTWIVGLLIAIFAAASLTQPQARWLNVLAAVWLFISTLAVFHPVPGTAWNNAIVAVIVFALALATGPAETRAMGPRGPVRA
jgi:hypothetical protein